MYQVSNAYNAAMHAQIRECPQHCRLYMGVFDATAAPDASYAFPAAEPWAEPSHISDDTALGSDYAAFETDYFRLDGLQALLPDNTAACTAQALVSAAQAGADGAFAASPTITITFPITHTMVGLTLTFGELPEDAPGQITAVWYAGATQLGTTTVSSGITPTFQWTLAVEGADKIVLRLDKAHGGYGRARLQKIEYGIGYSYQDSDILTLTEKHTDSPCSTELPTGSLSFELRNIDGRFDAYSDSGLIRFLRQRQEVTVTYGVTLPDGTAEWIPGGVWDMDTWSTDGDSASFSCTSLLERLTQTTYEQGTFDWMWHSVADTATAVLQDAGASNYSVSIHGSWVPGLFGGISLLDTHANILQLLANFSACRLFVDRNGTVSMRRVAYDFTAQSQTLSYAAAFSDAAAVYSGTAQDYATYEADYFRLDGTLQLLPDDTSSKITGAAACGTAVSDATGYLSPQMISAVTFASPTQIGSVTVDFGGQVPKYLGTRAQMDDGTVTQWYSINVHKNVERFSLPYTDAVSAIQFSVWYAKQPGQRGHLRAVTFHAAHDFTFALKELFDQPKTELQTRLKTISGNWKNHFAYADAAHLRKEYMGGNGMTKEKKPKKFLDGAVIYCLLMCTLIDVAVIILYWHSQTAPDSLGIAAMAAPWAIEFGAAAKIKLGKQPYNKSNPLNDERGE